MRFRRQLRAARLGVLLLPLLFPAAASRAGATRAQTQGAAAREKPAAAEGRMLEPSEFFRGFPEIAWGMKFQDALRAVERAGARPIRLSKEVETEFAWTGKFEGMEGRAAAHLLREGEGVTQITVGVYALERRKEVFEAWGKRVAARHGAAKEEESEYAVERLWRLKNGFAILLRTLKDANSPVVEIRWVKE